MAEFVSIPYDKDTLTFQVLHTDLDLSDILPFHSPGSSRITAATDIYDDLGNTASDGVTLASNNVLLHNTDVAYGFYSGSADPLMTYTLEEFESSTNNYRCRRYYYIAGTQVATGISSAYSAINTHLSFMFVYKDASGNYFMGEYDSAQAEKVDIALAPTFEQFGVGVFTGVKINVTNLRTAINVTPIIDRQIQTTDPYAPAGESEPGGGDGNFDFSSTDIPIPGNPTIGAMDTGFIGLYKPSAAQLKSLANYMWSGAFDINNFKKLFADPMDCIIGLHIIPTSNGHPAAAAASLYVGNISTGLSMPAVSEQYYECDCGSVSIPAKWGAYLDYSPYTKLSLYLPYIGIVPISPDDCMRGSITVKYKVDILSGTAVAFVYCMSNRGADGHVLYVYNGNCSCECPVTSGQYMNGALGILNFGAAVGEIGSGDVIGGIKDAFSSIQSMVKPEISRSGGFGGAGGLMSIQYPYLILNVPHMCIPGQQNTYIGYPSFVTKTIGDITGFTKIEVTHLNNMTCTQTESNEIISLLEEGVIL